MKRIKYWVVGANWDGYDMSDKFYRRGYWEMGHMDEDSPIQAKKRESIKAGDRIALKSMNGKGAKNITIRALGIVKEVEDKYVYIDWKIIGLKRKVNSHGLFGTIHGPYNNSEDWIKEIFCL